MISVVTCTIRDHLIDNVFENYTSQQWDDKELIIILNKDTMDITRWKKRAKEYKNISIYQLPEETTAGECQNFGVNKAKYPIIAKFDDDDYYSPYYLKGQMDAFNNTNAHIVGKKDCYYYLADKKMLLQTYHNKSLQNQYVERITDASLMFRKEIFNTLQFSNHKVNYDSNFQQECRNNGFKIYSTDRYNFTVIRRSDLNTHTWRITDEKISKFTEEVGKMDDFKSYVTKAI